MVGWGFFFSLPNMHKYAYNMLGMWLLFWWQGNPQPLPFGCAPGKSHSYAIAPNRTRQPCARSSTQMTNPYFCRQLNMWLLSLTHVYVLTTSMPNMRKCANSWNVMHLSITHNGGWIILLWRWITITKVTFTRYSVLPWASFMVRNLLFSLSYFKWK